MSKELKSMKFPGLDDVYEVPASKGVYPLLKTNIVEDGNETYEPVVSFQSRITSEWLTLTPSIKQDTGIWWYRVPEYGWYTISWPGSRARTVGGVVAACTIYESLGSVTFGDNDWSTIVSKCQSNDIPDTWLVGDSKTVGDYTVTIIGKNHDTDSSGNTCPLTLQVTAGPESDANASRMDDFTSSSFYSVMPIELKDGLRTVTGKAWDGTTTRQGWYPSVTEVKGASYVLSNLKYSENTTSDDYSNSTTIYGYSDTTETDTPNLSSHAGSQYAYYQAGNNINTSFWTRSTGYCDVNAGNAYSGTTADFTEYYNFYITTDYTATKVTTSADVTVGNPSVTVATHLASWVFCL